MFLFGNLLFVTYLCLTIKKYNFYTFNIMSKANVQAYMNEPKNYKEIRNEVTSLMTAIKSCKDRFKKINGLAIVQEQFQEPGETTLSSLNQAIYLLGEIYGYMLADDVLETVDSNNQ
jgi:hypothetical protein